MTTHIGLLRGLNVGGKNRVSMKDLVAILAASGARGARTYIQSGNVVFEADDVAGVRAAVESALAERGIRTALVTRTRDEWRALMVDPPFPAEHRHVVFLDTLPTRTEIDPDRSIGDRFELRGRELYLWLPNGVAGSKLTADWLDRTLGTTTTSRNWRTVLAMAELAG